MAPVAPATLNPKIYILHPGAIGDGLLALPSVRRLRRHYPKHDLVWIGSKSLGEVFVRSGEVNEGYSFDTWSFEKFFELQILDLPPSEWGSPDHIKIVGWMKDADSWWHSRLGHLEKSHVLFKSPYDPGLTALHMEDRYLQTIAKWGGEETPEPSDLDVQPLDGCFPCPRVGDRGQVEGSDRPLILVHPGSGSRKKCVSWPIVSEVVRCLQVRFPRWRICLIGGPSDSEFLDPLLASLKSVRTACFVNKELPDVCGLLKKTNLFIGHDSGLSHLAARMGVSSVLLFGPTDPAIWAPRGHHVKVLRNLELSFAPEDIVLVAEKSFNYRQSELVA